MTDRQTRPLDHQAALKFVHGLFQLLKKYVSDRNHSSTPELAELEQFLSSNITFIRNERTICLSLKDFITRLRKIRSFFEEVHFSSFLEDPIVSNNKIVLRYNLSCLLSTGQKKLFHIIDILTVDHDKVVNWLEVLHDKDSGELTAFHEQMD